MDKNEQKIVKNDKNTTSTFAKNMTLFYTAGR